MQRPRGSPGDATVVGAGPNGLAAAIALAQAGRSVTVYEAEDTVGGGARSSELTLPGFVHDVCSAIHPLALASPFLRTLPLAAHGLEWIHPPLPLAHPLDGGEVAVLERSVEATARAFGFADALRYRNLVGPFASRWDALGSDILGPLAHVPRHPLLLARFGLTALRSARAVAAEFHDRRARALFGGLAAHSLLPLEARFTASFGLVMGSTAHAFGWPIARGGAQRIVDALASQLRSLGGEILTGRRVRSLEELNARAVLLDLTPRQVAEIAGDRLPAGYVRALRRFRYGPGVFKVDYALDGPVPWQAEPCRRAGTVHVGGTLEEVAASEAAVARGEAPERPFVLAAQQSLFDSTRAPSGKHTLWTYCHVPNGSTADMTGRIEAQIERFAPGFRERVLARSVMSPAEVERRNPNHVGGDIAGGANDGLQLFARPTLARNPYATPARELFICSSSTPPGAGVHGMCGYHAARAALARALA